MPAGRLPVYTAELPHDVAIMRRSVSVLQYGQERHLQKEALKKLVVIPQNQKASDSHTSFLEKKMIYSINFFNPSISSIT